MESCENLKIYLDLEAESRNGYLDSPSVFAYFLENSPGSQSLDPLFVLSLLSAILLGYLLGSVPTAYFLVRWKSALDIRSEGSGNVGTLNSYEVTGSKWVGAAVLLGDALKGAAAVLAARFLWGGSFPHEASAGVAVIVGHNFPVWLRFRGGRGLATAVGVYAVMGWAVVLLWCVLWAAGNFFLKRVNPANALATALVLIGILVLPDAVVGLLAAGGTPLPAFRLFSTMVLVTILIKHVAPVREYLKERGRRINADEPQ